MRQKAEYRSAKRSRKLIRQAFLSLLQEKKDISKITVTDIVTTADINRSTFYAHYPDVLGVIEEIENEIIDKLMEFLGEFKFHSFFENPEPLLLKTCSYLEENQNFFRTLISSRGSYGFIEKMKNTLTEYMQSDDSIPLEKRNSKTFMMHVHYFAGGLLNMYQQWLCGNLDVTLEEIALETSVLIKGVQSK